VLAGLAPKTGLIKPRSRVSAFAVWKDHAGGVIVRGITLFPLATCGTKPDLKGRLKTDEDRPKMFRENLGRALLALSIAFALSAGCTVSNGPRHYLRSY
jgi:hypothetical protein